MHIDRMNAVPRISVIIPVYNIEACLSRCLDSLLAQSFRDFEVLCVDDESPDGSAAVIREYQLRDPRIHLLPQAHAGVSEARNLGIRQARGEYLLFFDGDDWAEPDMLASLLSGAERTGADITVCSACVHVEEESGQSQRQLEGLKRRLTVTDGIWEAGEDPLAPWSLLVVPGCWPFVWNKLIRSDLIRLNDIRFSPRLQLGEDGLFLQILFQYAKKICFTSRALYHYRYQRKASATVRLSRTRETRFSQHLQILNILCLELKQRQKLADSAPELQRWAVGFLYNDYVKLSSRQQLAASEQIRNVLEDASFGDGRADRITAKRLRILRETEKAPAELSRMCRMIYTKIENRMYRK